MNYSKGCRADDPCAKGTDTIDEILGASIVKPTPMLNLGRLVRKMRNQGQYGTCVGFGTTQALMNCARQQEGGADFDDVSALHAYVQARAIAGELHDPEDGTSVDSGLKGFGLGGFCWDKDVPYVPSRRQGSMQLAESLTALMKAGVKTHRITETGAAIDEVVKTALCSGKGVVGGWLVDQPFEDWVPGKPLWEGTNNGDGHCMCLQDYPDGNPRLTNSWGVDCGDNGFYTITWQGVRKAGALWVVDFIPSL